MYANILVPVVLGEGHNHDASFKAARLLADADARFTVIHVRDPIPEFVAAEIPDDVLSSNAQAMQEDLEALAQALPDATARVIQGQAGRAIVDYAASNDIDCIILASHKPGLETWLLGSTANRVTHHAKCSVHVIR